MVLLAVVDAGYRFILVDISAYGCNLDSGIFSHSHMGQMYMDHEYEIPLGKHLPNFSARGTMPFVIVGDEAFPGQLDLLRPYPGVKGAYFPWDQQLFNYRLSRARRCSENAFGILVQHFYLFQRRLNLHPDTTEIVIQAACVLHNFLTVPKEYQQVPDGEIPKSLEDTKGLRRLAMMCGNHASREAKHVCEVFKDYFKGPGAVDWQMTSIHKSPR